MNRQQSSTRNNGFLTAQGRFLMWDWILGSSDSQPPEYVWIGLATSMPFDEASAKEIPEIQKSYIYEGSQDPESEFQRLTFLTGYERVSYPFAVSKPGLDEGWNYSNDAAFYNAQRIDFPPVDEAWPEVKAWFISTEEKHGELLAYGRTNVLTVGSGDVVSIPANSLVLQTLAMR